MRPTVFFARADGIHLRLLSLFASAGQAYSTGIAGSRLALIKGDSPAAAPSPGKGNGAVGRTQLRTRKPLSR